MRIPMSTISKDTLLMKDSKTLGERFQEMLEDMAGSEISDSQAFILRMSAELEIPYDMIMHIPGVDGNTYAKLQRSIAKLAGEMPTLSRIRKVELALSEEEKAAFIESTAALLAMYPQHACYEELLSTYRDDFIRLFAGRCCTDPIFQLYQKDRPVLGEYFRFVELALQAEQSAEDAPRHMRDQGNQKVAISAELPHDDTCFDTVPCKNSLRSPAGMHSGYCEEAGLKKFIAAYTNFIKDVYLTEVQMQSLNSIVYNEENVLLAAPTGSGKTLVAIVGILKCLRLKKSKVYYIAPIKALIKEKALEIEEWMNFKATSFGQIGCKVVTLSSDDKINNSCVLQADVCVGTPEKLDILLRGGHSFGLVVLDEVHLLYYKRGDIIEAIVARLSCRIIALSATIPDIEEVRLFLRVPDRNCLCFGENHRPTRLRYEHHPVEINSESRSCVVARVLKEAKPLLLFVNERQATHDVAEQITSMLCKTDNAICEGCFIGDMHGGTTALPARRQSLVRTIFSDGNVISLIDQIRDSSLFRLISHGVGIHHAGLNKNDRHLMEDLFSLGAVSIMVSTSTLSWGINLPCNTVIVYGAFPQMEVIQMCGRAGRHIPPENARTPSCLSCFYGTVIQAEDEENDHFLGNICFHLNAEVCMGSVKCLTDGFAWLRKTFYYQKARLEMARKISGQRFAGEGSGPNTIDTMKTETDCLLERHIRTTIYQAVYESEKHGLVADFKPTLLGCLSHKFYLRLNEVQSLRSINILYDESLFLELLGSMLVDISSVALPGIQVPYPTYSAVSRLVQFVLCGYNAPLDICSFLQNVLRSLSAAFEYALAKGFASARHALQLYHRVSARLHMLRPQKASIPAVGKINSKMLSDTGHFCKLAYNDPKTLLYLNIEHNKFEDIHINATAYGSPGFVHISVSIYTEECVHSNELLLIVTDSLDQYIIYSKPLGVKAWNSVNIYLEDRRDRVFNIRIVSKHYPAMLRSCVSVSEMPAFQLPDTMHKILWEEESTDAQHDYLVDLDGCCKESFENRISYEELNYIIYSSCSPMGRLCVVENMSTSLKIAFEGHSLFCDLNAKRTSSSRLIRILNILQRGDARLLLAQWYHSDSSRIITSVILGCIKHKIEFACVGVDFGRLPKISRFFEISDMLRILPRDRSMDVLFSSLASSSVEGSHVVLCDSPAIARKYCDLYNTYLGGNPHLSTSSRAVYQENTEARTPIVFSASESVVPRHSNVYLVSETLSYSRILGLCRLAHYLCFYSNLYEYRSLQTQIKHDARAYIKSNSMEAGMLSTVGNDRMPEYSVDARQTISIAGMQLLCGGGLQPLPSEVGYYLDRNGTEYARFSTVIRKYALDTRTLDKLLSGLKDGIGLKAAFRLILGILRQENMVDCTTIEECIDCIMDARLLSPKGTFPSGEIPRAMEADDMALDGALGGILSARCWKGTAGPLGPKSRLGNGLRKYLCCSVEICFLRGHFKAITALVYAMQRLNGNNELFFRIEARKENKEWSYSACGSARDTENKDNRSLLSYLNSKGKNSDKNAVCGACGTENTGNDTAPQVFTIDVFKMVAEELLFYFIDESFNFEIVRILHTGRYLVTWPQAVYVLCNYGQGSVYLENGLAP